MTPKKRGLPSYRVDGVEDVDMDETEDNPFKRAR